MLSPIARFRHPSTTRNLATLPPFTPYNPHHRPINHSLLPTWATYATAIPTPTNLTGNATAVRVSAGVQSSQAAGIVIGLIILLGMLVGMVVVLVKGQMGWCGVVRRWIKEKGVGVGVLRQAKASGMGGGGEGDVESGSGERQVRFQRVDVVDRKAEMARRVVEVVKGCWDRVSSAVQGYIQEKRTIKAMRMQMQAENEKNSLAKAIDASKEISTPPTSSYDSYSSPFSDETSQEDKEITVSPAKPKGPRSMTVTSPPYTCTYPPGFSSDTSSTSDEVSVSKYTSRDVTRQRDHQKACPELLNVERVKRYTVQLVKCCRKSVKVVREKFLLLKKKEGESPEVKIKEEVMSPTSTTSTSTPDIHSIKTTPLNSCAHDSSTHNWSQRREESSSTTTDTDTSHLLSDSTSPHPESGSQNSPASIIPEPLHPSPQTRRQELHNPTPAPRPHPLPLPPTLSCFRSHLPPPPTTSTDEENAPSLSGIDSLGDAWARAGRAHLSRNRNRNRHVTFEDEIKIQHSSTSEMEMEFVHNGDGQGGVEGDTPEELRLPLYVALGAERGERVCNRERRRRERGGGFRREET